MPDIIVTDIQMPGSVDGLSLCSNVRAVYPELPVVIVSAHLGINVAKTDSNTKFLPKPYSLPELVKVVQSQLETSE